MPQLEAPQVDQRLDSDEEVQTQDSLDRKAVIEGADLDLELSGLQVTDGEAVESLGEDELDATDPTDAPQSVLWLRYDTYRKDGVCGNDRGRGAGVENDVVEDQVPTPK